MLIRFLAGTKSAAGAVRADTVASTSDNTRHVPHQALRSGEPGSVLNFTERHRRIFDALSSRMEVAQYLTVAASPLHNLAVNLSCPFAKAKTHV